LALEEAALGKTASQLVLGDVYHSILLVVGTFLAAISFD